MVAAHLEPSVHQHSGLIVTFNGCEIGTDGVCRYQIWVISGVRQWSVFRRYREFRRLQAALNNNGLLPALPGKSQLRKRFSERFRCQRYAALESWLKAVMAVDPTCERSPALHRFLRPDASLHRDTASLVGDPTPGAFKRASSDVSTQISKISSTASFTSIDEQ
jgi:hypothetical protein